MGIAGFDWLVLDLEHGAGDEPVLLDATAGARRQQHGRRSCGSRRSTRRAILHALDLGADGVMVPRVRTVADAQACVEFAATPAAEGSPGTTARGIGASRRGRSPTADARGRVRGPDRDRRGARGGGRDRRGRRRRRAVRRPLRPLARARARLPARRSAAAQRVAAVAEAAREHGKAAGMLVGSVDQARGLRDARLHVPRLRLGRRAAGDGGCSESPASSASLPVPRSRHGRPTEVASTMKMYVAGEWVGGRRRMCDREPVVGRRCRHRPDRECCAG